MTKAEAFRTCAPAGALAFALLTSGCSEKPASPDPGPKIGIVYTAPIPVINEIIAGFEARVRQDFPTAQFIARHADDREEQYEPTVAAVLAQRPTLMAPITTPMTKLTVQSARGATPVVFMGVTDPVGAGVARSIARPEIATGSSDLCPFEALLKITRDTMPDAKVVGLPYDPTDQPAVFGRGRILELAPKFGFRVVDAQVTSADELGTTVSALATRSDAVLIAADNLMMNNPAVVVNAARQRGRPAFACDSASVKAGALAGVSVNYREIGVLAGERAVQVLKGAKPGDLPVGVLQSGGLLSNLKAACALRRNATAFPKEATPVDPGTVCNGTAVAK